MNNLAPMKNCPGVGGGGVQGNLNWMPGYIRLSLPFTCIVNTAGCHSILHVL